MSNWRGSSPNRLRGRPWRRLRDSLLAREPLCRTCNARGRVRVATEVDHITPLAEGGTDDPSNLAPICTPCHKAKTASESARARGGRGKVAIGADGWPIG